MHDCVMNAEIDAELSDIITPLRILDPKRPGRLHSIVSAERLARATDELGVGSLGSACAL